MNDLFSNGQSVALSLGLAAGIVLLALLIHFIVFKIYASLGRRKPGLLVFGGALLKHSRKPTRLLLPILALYIFRPVLTNRLTANVATILNDVLYILLVLALAWLFIRLTAVLQEVVAQHYQLDVADNLTARKVRTQVIILRRILSVAIVVLALAAILLHFEGFRELGTGLLASAGVVGIIVGFAAQRTLGNLLAGFQIAITQPFRVDDVVVVEGEWGRIEEITLTYVVVRIWDLRRLVLPISYFIEKPFQNWTRTSAAILGTVFLHVDYTVPVEAVRQELQRLLDASELWDREVCRLHVTETTKQTVELRALMSAANSGDAFELRAEIREKLIAFLQREYPEALPRIRAEVQEKADV